MRMQCTLSENLHDHRLIRSRRKVHGRKVLGSAGLSPQLISPSLLCMIWYPVAVPYMPLTLTLYCHRKCCGIKSWTENAKQGVKKTKKDLTASADSAWLGQYLYSPVITTISKDEEKLKWGKIEFEEAIWNGHERDRLRELVNSKKCEHKHWNGTSATDVAVVTRDDLHIQRSGGRGLCEAEARNGEL